MLTKNKKKTDLPLISIIVPCFNSADTIVETLESIIIQTYTNWECVIIDDNSNDNSLTIIKKFTSEYSDKIKKYKNNKKGACSARNYGVELSKGSYIKFLDADDVFFDENVLENQINSLKFENIDILYGKEYYYNNKFNEENIIKVRGGKISRENPSTFFRCFPITSSLLVNRNILLQIKWNEILQSGQEFFLLFQCYIRGYSFYYQDIPVAKIRITNSKYRISNKNPKVYANQTVTLVNEMYKDLENQKNINPKLFDEFYKKILSFSYKAISQRNIVAAKKINKVLFNYKVPLVNDNYLSLLYRINQKSFFLGFIFYRLIMRKKGNILF